MPYRRLRGSAAPHEHVEVALIVDEDDANAHPAVLLADIADLTAAAMAEGRRVYIHCVRSETRTPAALATFYARHRAMAVADALREAERILGTRVRPGFARHVPEAAAIKDCSGPSPSCPSAPPGGGHQGGSTSSSG